MAQRVFLTETPPQTDERVASVREEAGGITRLREIIDKRFTSRDGGPGEAATTSIFSAKRLFTCSEEYDILIR